ncbi:hypothetical protein [Micromonospora sp. NPDC048947]|uniref:hypothetical protein n=1 Tax=Micromonospora sp. NPDC048947 TaxID=3154826 RepID=UPI0033E155FD
MVVRCCSRRRTAVDQEAADLLPCRLSTGMCWGEVSALPPGAVNVARGTVSIVQVLRKVNRRWVVEPKPKTKQGYQEALLTAAVARMVAERCAATSREPGRQFVFAAPRGNHWRYEDFYTDRWVEIRDLAREKGLPRRMTMHGLWHSLLTCWPPRASIWRRCGRWPGTPACRRR